MLPINDSLKTKDKYRLKINMEKNSLQLEMKENWTSNTQIRQTDFKNKVHNKRGRNNNDKMINPIRGYNNYKYLYTQYRGI